MTDAPATRAARHNSAGWLIQRLSGRFERAMDRALARHGLALGQFALLMAVLEQDALIQTELGTIFGMPAWKISRYLDGLAAAGLITREADPASRRAHRIHATEAARALAPRLRAEAEAVNAALLASLAPAQRETLVALLRQVVVPGETF